MKNSNICGLAVAWRGRAVLCRGLLDASVAAAGGGDASLAALSAALPQRLGSSGGAVARGSSTAEYWRERGEMQATGVAGWAFVPEGAEGLLLQPLEPLEGRSSSDGGGGSAAAPEGALVLLCDRPRALGRKEQLWAAALAAKLHAALRDADAGAGAGD